MQRMINILHERYTQEQLDGMPQYQRLMSLYRDDPMDDVAGRSANDILGILRILPHLTCEKMLMGSNCNGLVRA